MGGRREREDRVQAHVGRAIKIIALPHIYVFKET